MTTTSSSLRILAAMLEDLRRQADDLHEVALAQLARDRPEDARAARVVGGIDQHGGVLVEGDVGAVLAAQLATGANHHGLNHLALLDRALRVRALDGADDHVAHSGVAPVRTALHADAQQLARTRVVGHLESRLLLDHRTVASPTWPSPGPRPGASASCATAACT